ncbi:arsenosugar biosynthesis radical SAM (seleno)protein ArsS [Pseudomarimonas salicorniae]|uniref:Arsenosugar biosynthesis radical SAM protein ArsS n=1 Tax=Pseudomarimonas salicorniae TaxID=2933270 RepID=A0ABT0GKN2_9GAMM|nr:arsenosugar biosynthesis radical SAM (seleno)protein ArsS [Lysobacter sp. CAU 1642]MCK7595103.1 arsenosugar biosynthesis radical SAM protein ArsS [Lysobacter sp. CAU 1642]
MRDTLPLLEPSDFPAIDRRALGTLQLNLGYLCNLSCIHCHVNAGPRRTELMDRETMQLALDAARRHGVRQFDLTGGSPEMNPDFRWLVTSAREAGIAVMDRLNPTIMEEPGYEWVGEFLAANRVEVVASLPCYSAANVDEQRGNGVFESSIRALQTLNALGYGQLGSPLVLNLVYNPNGAFLPPPQAALEADYKRLLQEQFGIVFNQLFALANMPIKRFGSWLLSKGRFEAYMATLRDAHRDENLGSVMCRDLLSVDYRGYVYDCDFNQMLDLPAGPDDGHRLHLRDLLTGEVPKSIRVAGHCYGCTAGQGSSCGGALAA